MNKNFARPLSGVATYEELVYDKKENEELFDILTNEYISSLLNLEISALAPNYLTEEEMAILEENEFYKDLVYYNIYNRSKKLVDISTFKYIFLDTWSNFEIRLNDDKHIKRIFQLGKLHNNNLLIQLFLGCNLMSFDDFYQKKYIKKILQLEVLCRVNYIRKGVNSYEYYSSNKELDKIRKKDISELLNEYESYKSFYDEQKEFLKSFLLDNNLNLNNSFTTDGLGNFVKKEKVYEIKINK